MVIPRPGWLVLLSKTNDLVKEPDLPIRSRGKVYISINRETPNLIHPALAGVAGVMLRLRRQQTAPRASRQHNMTGTQREQTPPCSNHIPLQ